MWVRRTSWCMYLSRSAFSIEAGGREVGDHLVHADDGQSGDLHEVRVVDAAGDVAVGGRFFGGQDAVEQGEMLCGLALGVTSFV